MFFELTQKMDNFYILLPAVMIQLEKGVGGVLGVGSNV